MGIEDGDLRSSIFDSRSPMVSFREVVGDEESFFRIKISHGAGPEHTAEGFEMTVIDLGN